MLNQTIQKIEDIDEELQALRNKRKEIVRKITTIDDRIIELKIKREELSENRIKLENNSR